MTSHRNIIAAILLLLSCAGCDQGAPAPEVKATSRADRTLPNIILLTVDTLRADHLRLYGYARNTMPTIDALSRSAIVFKQAVVPRGSTRPSYASMLTGYYPFRHGVRSNGTVLHEQITTLPEMLKQVGYHTAGFVSNFVLIGELSGMQQGFDIYDDRLEEKEANRNNFERTAANTLQAILTWLDSKPPEPFFLFVNFIDPHGPYTPPEHFLRLYHSNKKYLLTRSQIPKYQAIPGVTNYFDYIDRYDAEISYVDASMHLLIEELKQRGLWKDALVIFTADHGESLGEHNILFEHHIHLWEETMRVPLVMRLPETPQPQAGIPPQAVDLLASPMDLTPTILAYLHVKAAQPFDGQDLLARLRGGKADGRQFFLEFPNVATPGVVHADIYAARTSSHKLIQSFAPTTGKLLQQVVFNIKQDALEQQPIPYDATVALHAKLNRYLTSMVDRVRRYTLPFVVTEYEMPRKQRAAFIGQRKSGKRIIKRLTKEQLDRLRSLGYVQ